MDSITLAVALKVFALSEIIFLGRPLLAIYLFKQWMNAKVDNSLTSSRWMALVTQQVNKQIHTFLSSEQLVHHT